MSGHAEGAITSTITDTAGTYTLAGGGATQLAMSADDEITINLTTLTADATKIAEIEDLVQANGVKSLTGTVTLDASQAATVGAITDSSNKIALDFELSNQANIAQASTLKGNTSGTLTAHSTGISDSVGNYVNGGNTAISSGFTTIKDADGDVNVTVTGLGTPATTANMTSLNLIAAATTGTTTSTFTAQHVLLRFKCFSVCLWS